MNVVLFLIRRDQWTVKKLPFSTSTFVSLFTQAVPRFYPHH